MMATGLNSLGFGSYARKRRPGVRSENNPADMAILNMTVDHQPLFRRRGTGALQNRENRSIDDIFRGLLSEANRELASLLRDVRTESHGPVLGDAIYRGGVGRLHLLARGIALDLEPPVAAVAPVPEHMRAALVRCGCDVV